MDIAYWIKKALYLFGYPRVVIINQDKDKVEAYVRLVKASLYFVASD